MSPVRLARYALGALSIFLLFEVLIGIVLSEGAIRRPPTRSAAVDESIGLTLIASDGVTLHASIIHPPRPTGTCVIVLHGVADNRRGAMGFAPRLLREGYSVVLPDSRGHGDSGGNFVTYGLLEADDINRWAQKLSPDCPNGIYGLGESLGGATLIQAAARGNYFRAIVAESSYSSFVSVATDRIAQRTSKAVAIPLVYSGLAYAKLRYGFNLLDASPEHAAAQTKTPILLIHGLADDETFPEHAKRIAAQNRNISLWLVPNARHVGASSANPTEFWNHVLDWYRRHESRIQ